MAVGNTSGSIAMNQNLQLEREEVIKLQRVGIRDAYPFLCGFIFVDLALSVSTKLCRFRICT